MKSHATDAIRKERQQLLKLRTGLNAQQKDLQKRLSDIDKKLQAYDLFEKALHPRLQPALHPPRRARRSGSQMNSRTSELLEVVRSAGDSGIGRADLIAKFRAKGQKEAWRLTNSLVTLKRRGLIRTKQRGVYTTALPRAELKREGASRRQASRRRPPHRGRRIESKTS